MYTYKIYEEWFGGCGFFIVKSESKRSPGTDFAAEDMKENIRGIFAYKATNFRISNRIAINRLNIRNLEYESNIRPILKR